MCGVLVHKVRALLEVSRFHAAPEIGSFFINLESCLVFDFFAIIDDVRDECDGELLQSGEPERTEFFIVVPNTGFDVDLYPFWDHFGFTAFLEESYVAAVPVRLVPESFQADKSRFVVVFVVGDTLSGVGVWCEVVTINNRTGAVRVEE